MKTAEERYNEIAQELAASDDSVTIGQMMGMPCMKVMGKVFAGYYDECGIFKLTGESHKKALASPGAKLFDPSGMGRAMKEWVQVPYTRVKSWRTLAEAAKNYVSASAKAAPKKKVNPVKKEAPKRTK